MNTARNPGARRLDSRSGPAVRTCSHLLVAFSLAVLLAGCGKESESVNPPASSVSATQEAPQVVPTPQQTPQAPLAVVELTELNRELRKWILRNRRPPQSFEEFAASAPVQATPPPPGKKYVLTKQMRIVLADR